MRRRGNGHGSSSMTALATNADAPAQATRRAVALLAFCCLLWGYSFPTMKVAIAAFEHNLPAAAVGRTDNPPHADGQRPILPPSLEGGINATFNGWRFTLATLLYWLLTRARQRGHSRAELRGGFMIGAFFSAGMFVQIAGLRYTLPSISGFLTALAVVFAPLAQAFLFRRHVGLYTWLAIAVAIAGIVILSLPNPDAVRALPPVNPPIPYLGEALTILGAVLFTCQILCVDHYGRQADATRLTLVMFATTALLSLALGAVLGGSGIYNGHVLSGVATDHTFHWSLLTLVAFTSVLALHLMNLYQPFIAPAKACVVYCLEPVFATLFSVLFQTERLTAATVLGGAVILAAVLLVARQQEHRAPST